ncbi:dipeptide ABC transporter ATP-binding protein [Streptomyces yerevanensis]|uniref:dipeptide ABC transporter ATP-binding protein n=1 Tax=Streptomyces yerevanensis TaxID=66378 RepID=UPI00068DA072|nr:ABC transporter ATP-binding protein [Streptomyces yerevanensis]
MTSSTPTTSPTPTASPSQDALLDVRGLSVDFGAPDGASVHAVRDVGFTLRRGETLAVVGESGSGKSTTALALTRMLPDTGRITAGSVRLGDTELTGASEEELRAVRGARIGMIFQDPMTSLNPVLSIRTHLDEVLRAHGHGDRAARRARAEELLGLVGIPDPRRRLDDHPHQFSGGQRQRILIAMALANEPEVLVADEPTTALDATVQEQILRLLTRLNEETGTALVLITHNMGVVARTCARLLVMYGGTVVEDGPTAEVLTRPRHPYTAGLLAAVPRLSSPSGTRLSGIPGSPPDLSLPLTGCAFAARCASADERCGSKSPLLESPELESPLLEATSQAGHHVACWHPGTAASTVAVAAPPVRSRYRNPAELARREAELEVRLEVEGEPEDQLPAGDAPLLETSALRKEFRGRGRVGRRNRLVAVDDVSLRLHQGETLGLVGESGSGKSTLARLLTHAHPADGGTIRLRGQDVTRPSRTALRTLRRQVQMVFQDPYASLNPRMTVGDIVGEPILVHGLHPDRAAREARVAELLELVGLDPAAVDRLPRAFSGGQRQRIGIARALAPEPSLLICDEPVSALDVSVQAQIVNLLSDLQHDLGLALLFIAHDLAVVRQVSHRIAVMHRGRIVETGPVDEVCESPQHPYTQNLLSAVPDPVPASALGVPAA